MDHARAIEARELEDELSVGSAKIHYGAYIRPLLEIIGPNSEQGG